MENPIAENSYKEIRRKAKEYYKQIGYVWSPALNDYVIFNNVGFTHLLRKQGALRMKSEQKRRLILLGEAVEIITNPAIVVKHQRKEILDLPRRDDGGIVLPISADFWKLTQEKDDKIIHVVIRQLMGGSKHFFSVYAKEQKTAQ